MRLLIAALALLVSVGFGQEVRPKVRDAGKGLPAESQQMRPMSDPKALSLFQAIERAIISENIGLLSSSFGKQVSMTMSGSESGFFSSAQAVAVLKKYFSSRKPTQFSFTRVNDTVAHPYATGRLDYVLRGNKESVQVYVSLARQDAAWVISQFNIY